MSGRVLLDTNIVIALFAGEFAVKNNVAAADEVFLSSIALQHDLTLVTRDPHFDEVESLKVVMW